MFCCCSAPSAAPHLQRAGYRNLHTTTDPEHVLPLFAQCQPDLVLLDLMKPRMDGFGVMQGNRIRIFETPRRCHFERSAAKNERNAVEKSGVGLVSQDFSTAFSRSGSKTPLEMTPVLSHEILMRLP